MNNKQPTINVWEKRIKITAKRFGLSEAKVAAFIKDYINAGFEEVLAGRQFDFFVNFKVRIIKEKQTNFFVFSKKAMKKMAVINPRPGYQYRFRTKSSLLKNSCRKLIVDEKYQRQLNKILCNTNKDYIYGNQQKSIY